MTGKICCGQQKWNFCPKKYQILTCFVRSIFKSSEKVRFFHELFAECRKSSRNLLHTEIHFSHLHICRKSEVSILWKCRKNSSNLLHTRMVTRESAELVRFAGKTQGRKTEVRLYLNIRTYFCISVLKIAWYAS